MIVITYNAVSTGYNLEPVTGLHRHQPIAPVPFVGNDRDLVAIVIDGLIHGLVDVEALDDFDFKVDPRQVRADDIRAVRRTRKLTTAPGVVSTGNQFVAPGAFTPFSLLAGVHALDTHLT